MTPAASAARIDSPALTCSRSRWAEFDMLPVGAEEGFSAALDVGRAGHEAAQPCRSALEALLRGASIRFRTTLRRESMKRLAIVRDPESDPFPFSEEELFQAFRLVTDEQAARSQAREVIVAVAAEPRWEMSDESLALLALGSTSAATKVELIRRQRDADRNA